MLLGHAVSVRPEVAQVANAPIGPYVESKQDIASYRETT